MRTHIIPTGYHTPRCGPVKRTTNSGDDKAPVTNPVIPLCANAASTSYLCLSIATTPAPWFVPPGLYGPSDNKVPYASTSSEHHDMHTHPIIII